MADDILIIGAGQAAAQAVQSLRSEGFEGTIRIFGDEPYAPYQRPPLSKKFLAGEIGYDRVELKAQDYYEQANVETHWSTRVTEIDRKAKHVLTGDGREFAYGKLILATGSRVRELNVPGFELEGVHYLRNIDDVKSIQAHFREGAKMVVVGGGYIGLEVAAVAAKRGIDVTVLETADRVMARVVDPIVSRFYERVHKEEGVKIETGVTVSGFEGTDKITAVTSGEGKSYPCDFVVVGIGIIPNTELAAEAGLEVENGIVVDEFCRTSDPDIFAAGDCTSHPNAIYGHRLRLESVQNAIEQGKTAAATLTGKEKPYNQVPWFWSDQYDMKLQIVGLSQGYTEAVVRGDPATGRSFAVFYLKDGVLVAVDAVNRAPEFMMAKMLTQKKATLDPARIRDESINVKEIAG
ncbi:FAD-dependent oxidoreductase [Parvibaculum sp.]|jgi:3-phenylpropionate/trans-cinnamate dioxygenase ferredoxin reductase component|uniref:NAD(P)/FAD-dependent oxidoreductase n=1 Tax=Parvibaculum sp. TaxID=2024848 RepID=UPI000C376257|nr:FAD-dependent oxidoreductase [Parvibaculum sp.]MAM94452.1 pyridine nucleotide-disulfide oxidoreductase [Parvibaculum sp.]|tara:strand:+ start:20394 stop:21614 length:1221 start_codon:yes stop_codon:yes gene_type:complete